MRNSTNSTCLCCKCHVPVDGGFVEEGWSEKPKVRCCRCTNKYRDIEASLGTTAADERFGLKAESKKELTQRRNYWFRRYQRKVLMQGTRSDSV